MTVIEVRATVIGIEDRLVAIYRSAFDDPDPSLFRDDQLVRHPDRDGFRIALAREDEHPDAPIVGFAYAYTGRRGQWWTDRMREQVPPAVFERWFDGHCEVVTLAVHADHQRRGIGADLMRTIVAEATNPTALLSTDAGDTPARRLYRRLGWQPVAEIDDGEVTILGLPLR